MPHREVKINKWHEVIQLYQSLSCQSLLTLIKSETQEVRQVKEYGLKFIQNNRSYISPFRAAVKVLIGKTVSLRFV